MKSIITKHAQYESLFSLECNFAAMALGKYNGVQCATGTITHRPPHTSKSSIITSLASMMRQEYPR